MAQVIANFLISSSSYFLIALSFWLIYRTSRFFHLAHGAIVVVGGYCAYAALQHIPYAPGSFLVSLAAILAAVIGSSLIGLFVNWTIYDTLRKRKASNLIFLLASFGVLMICQASLALVFGSQALSVGIAHLPRTMSILGATLTTYHVAIIGSSLLLAFLFYWLLEYTRIGTMMTAVAEDAFGARVVGINARRVIALSFLVGSAIAGLAGALIGFDTGIEPYMGFSLLLQGIIAMIIGGRASIIGVALGCILLAGIENAALMVFPAMWKNTVAFIILVLFLTLRPQGLIGQTEGRAS